MRRITIYADEDTARQAVEWLEQHGLDYFSEDYAEPTLQRRQPPARRAPPERTEEGPGMLMPTKAPTKKKAGPGRKVGPVAAFIMQVVKETGVISTDELVEMAKDRGWQAKQVRDTLRRLKASGKLQAGDTAAQWKWIMKKGFGNG